jgi:hypothetical protein
VEGGRKQIEQIDLSKIEWPYIKIKEDTQTIQSKLASPTNSERLGSVDTSIRIPPTIKHKYKTPEKRSSVAKH